MAGKLELEVISSHFGRNVFQYTYNFNSVILFYWRICGNDISCFIIKGSEFDAVDEFSKWPMDCTLVDCTLVWVLWVFSWYFNPFRDLNILLHIEHLKCISLEWVNEWSLNSPLLLNAFPQIRHIKSFVSLCVIWCFWTSWSVLNNLLQSGQGNVLSSLWRYAWYFNFVVVLKLFPQISHSKLPHSLCSRMWFLKLCSALNDFWQISHVKFFSVKCVGMWSFNLYFALKILKQILQVNILGAFFTSKLFKPLVDGSW
jgi:hypothetical protein